MLSNAKHLGFSRSHEAEILRLRLRMTVRAVSALTVTIVSHQSRRRRRLIPKINVVLNLLGQAFA
jgi:hypothetical protein